MAQQRLLEGEYENVIDMKSDDEELRKLRAENRRLDEALRGVRNELGQAIADKENLERSIRALRSQLSPLHRYLRALFGEIELAEGEEQAVQAPSSAGPAPAAESNMSDARWESYKTAFPGVRAEIITALQVHPQMTIIQLAAICHRDYSTIKDSLPALVKAGAVKRDGTKNALFSLNR